MPSAHIMKIRKVSFEYVGKNEDIEIFFKAAVNDYLRAGNLAKGSDAAFVGSVEILLNKANSESLGSFA